MSEQQLKIERLKLDLIPGHAGLQESVGLHVPGMHCPQAVMTRARLFGLRDSEGADGVNMREDLEEAITHLLVEYLGLKRVRDALVEQALTRQPHQWTEVIAFVPNTTTPVPIAEVKGLQDYIREGLENGTLVIGGSISPRREHQPSGCICPPPGFAGAWGAGPCPVHMGLRALTGNRTAGQAMADLMEKRGEFEAASVNPLMHIMNRDIELMYPHRVEPIEMTKLTALSMGGIINNDDMVGLEV